MGRRMKIGRFMRHPLQEAGDGRIGAKPCVIIPEPTQFGIAKARMDGAVANRVERDQSPPTPAFGNGVVPFGARTHRTCAQPAYLTFRSGQMGHANLGLARAAYNRSASAASRINVPIQPVR